MVESIYSMLTISEEEARNGTSRSLTLPDGSKIIVAVPAQVCDGQVLRLAGVVSSTHGSEQAGTLVLTLNVLTGEPTHRPTSSEETVPAAGEPGQAALPDPQAPAPAVPYEYAPACAVQPAPVLPLPQASAPMRTSVLLALIGAVLVVLLGGSLGGILLVTRYTRTTALNAATATAQAGFVAATSSTRATALPQYITATALAGASTSAAALPDPYAGGKLLLSDALGGNRTGGSWFWQEDSHCVFSAGGYHVIDTSAQYIQDCDLDTASQLTNYAVEFKMAIVRGDVGGIVFRDDPIFEQQDLAYMLVFDTRGNYQLLFYDNQTPTRLAAGQSQAFRGGYNEVNTIGIVASGSTLTWYANGQQVGSLHDGRYNEGGIRLTTWVYRGRSGTSETVFSDLRLWTL